MIRSMYIENFKSIEATSLELGRFNVLIGENGSGKSNILEALVVAFRGFPELEEIAARGVRITKPDLMSSALVESTRAPTKFVCVSDDGAWRDDLVWSPNSVRSDRADEVKSAADAALMRGDSEAALRSLKEAMKLLMPISSRPDFRIYSPENSALRSYQEEQQLRPLGVRGEGLFAHLKELSEQENAVELIGELTTRLKLFDWFERVEVPKDLGPGEQRLSIFDRYLKKGALFDQRSANEGFLFALFYFTLLVSPAVPKFFAIDNIDTSLNPRLCVRLVQEMVPLAKQHDKQLVVTTHNPSILDGLDLTDDEQRLFAVERTKSGATRVRRIPAPTLVGDRAPLPLSEAFVRGYLGGVPKSF